MLKDTTIVASEQSAVVSLQDGQAALEILHLKAIGVHIPPILILTHDQSSNQTP